MLIYKSRNFDLYSTNLSSRRPPFEFVNHRGTCAALLVDENEEIGLVAHTHPAIGRTLFVLPSVILDYEHRIEEILIEAIKSETSISLNQNQLHRLTSLYASPNYTTELATLYLAHIGKVQKKYSENLRWFSLYELNNLIRTQEILDLKTVAAITSYQAILWNEEYETK